MMSTAGKADPNGLGVDRTAITDHLALTFFASIGGSVPETEDVPTPRILSAPIRSAQRMLTKA